MWRAHNGLLEFVSDSDLEDKKGIVLLVPPEENIKTSDRTSRSRA